MIELAFCLGVVMQYIFYLKGTNVWPILEGCTWFIIGFYWILALFMSVFAIQRKLKRRMQVGNLAETTKMDIALQENGLQSQTTFSSNAPGADSITELNVVHLDKEGEERA